MVNTSKKWMKTYKNWRKTWKIRLKNGRKPRNNRRKPYGNWRKQWKIEEYFGKMDANHGKIHENHRKINEHLEKSMKTMENSISAMGKNMEPVEKMDEQCGWEILATKCSKWEILAAKTKEGSLDDPPKKMPQQNANLISHRIYFRITFESPKKINSFSKYFPVKKTVLNYFRTWKTFSFCFRHYRCDCHSDLRDPGRICCNKLKVMFWEHSVTMEN